MQNYQISVYLDTRRPKKSGKFPVKLRVYTKTPRKQKFYPLDFEFTEKEFQSIWETTKPRNEHKDIRDQIQSVLLKAKNVARSMPIFSYDTFEKLLFSNVGQGDVCFFVDEIIEKLKKQNRINTLKNYENTKKHICSFSGSSTQIGEITPEYLRDFEIFLRDVKEQKQNTIAGYMRQVRAIFNHAINSGAVSQEYYPFGSDRSKKYEIRLGTSIKKALNREHLKLLFEYDPESKTQQTAKDFFFFSYFGNGINLKDILTLKFENLLPEHKKPDAIVFSRSKTKNTRKQQTATTIYLKPFMVDFLGKYSNPDKSPGNYILPILETTDTPEQQHRKITTKTFTINQSLKNICDHLEIPKISMISARHSFATNAVRNGLPLEFVGESMGHSDKRTTQIYFAGFSLDQQRELSKRATEF